MNQSSFFGDGEENAGGPPSRDDEPRIATEAEVRELAREYFDLPAPPEAEPPLLKAKREQAARAGFARAGRRGLVAKWSRQFSYISLHDPIDGTWHDINWKAAPGWSRWEVRRRKDLYKAGDRHAYDLTSSQMEEVWGADHPPEPEFGIVEDHPVEDST